MAAWDANFGQILFFRLGPWEEGNMGAWPTALLFLSAKQFCLGIFLLWSLPCHCTIDGSSYSDLEARGCYLVRTFYGLGHWLRVRTAQHWEGASRAGQIALPRWTPMGCRPIPRLQSGWLPSILMRHGFLTQPWHSALTWLQYFKFGVASCRDSE